MESLKVCVKSVLNTNYSDYEIIVVDNASTDGSPEAVARDFDFVKLIRNKENLGYAGGNNVGMKYAIEHGADYVLLLNDDVVVEPNFLKELVNVAENDPKIGAVGPNIKFEESSIKKYYGKSYFGITYKKLSNLNKPEETDYMFGTAILVKKEVIMTVGLLDPNFFLYAEDVDWCYRMKKAGYKIVYVPSAKVCHSGARAYGLSRSFSRRGSGVSYFLYYWTRNELLFAQKHLNPLLFIPLWIQRFIFRMITFALKTKNIKVIKAIMKGFFDFTKGKYGKTLPS